MNDAFGVSLSQKFPDFSKFVQRAKSTYINDVGAKSESRVQSDAKISYFIFWFDNSSADSELRDTVTGRITAREEVMTSVLVG